MALRTHLVVHRANDTLAPAFDRRVRLESQRGFGAAAVFDWTFDFWCDHRSDLPRSRKTLHPSAVLGSSYRRSGVAPNTPRGDTRTRLVAFHAWPGSFAAYSVGLMPIAGKSEARFSCAWIGSRRIGAQVDLGNKVYRYPSHFDLVLR